MSGEEAKAFIATYFRLAFRAPDLLVNLYDPLAEIIRYKSSQRFQVKNGQDIPILPFDSVASIVRIFSHTQTVALNNLIISVYGAITIKTNFKKFTQQFVLKQNKGKWMIISDTFYEFEPPKSELICADHPQMSGSADDRLIPPRYDSPPYVPRFDPQVGSKRPRAQDFDPARSLTIMNLSSTYSGDELRDIFAQFGPITKQFYTHNTIYLEYEDPEMMEAAVAHPPLYHGMYTKVEKGVVQKGMMRK